MGITVELVGVGEGSGTFAGICTLGNASCTPGGGVCAGTLGGKPAEGDPRSSTFHCWIVLGVFIGLMTEFGEQSWTITGDCTLDVGCMLVGCGCARTLGGNQQLQKSGKFLLQHSLKPGILPFWGAGVLEFHCYFWLRSYSVMFFYLFRLRVIRLSTWFPFPVFLIIVFSWCAVIALPPPVVMLFARVGTARALFVEWLAFSGSDIWINVGMFCFMSWPPSIHSCTCLLAKLVNCSICSF